MPTPDSWTVRHIPDGKYKLLPWTLIQGEREALHFASEADAAASRTFHILFFGALNAAILLGATFDDAWEASRELTSTLSLLDS